MSDTTSEPEAASKPEPAPISPPPPAEPAKREKAAKRERPPLLQNAALLAYVGLAGLLITIVLAPPNSLPLMGVLLAGLVLAATDDERVADTHRERDGVAWCWPRQMAYAA